LPPSIASDTAVMTPTCSPEDGKNAFTAVGRADARFEQTILYPIASISFIPGEEQRNKAEQSAAEQSAAGTTAAESVERRAETKGNVDQQRTRRTQRRISVSQMLARIRQHIVAVDTQGGNRMRESCTYGTPLWTGFTRWGAAHSSLSPSAMAAIARA
jgi:hypothetical protein